MVVVRESPRAVFSPQKNDTQWPPRSPFQAMLSSPSGRQKWQDRRQRQDARSVSPSPVKRAMPEVQHSRTTEADALGEDDEDEEMIQLKLQAIEARMKLKKLQKAKRDATEDTLIDDGDPRLLISHFSARKSPRPMGQSVRLHDKIEVPLSPGKDRVLQPKEQTSPARARLGLASTMKADGVSLKRARNGTHPQRPDPRQVGGAQDPASTLPPALSFSERLARSKIDAQEERERKTRIETARSSGFRRGAAGTPRSIAMTTVSTPLCSDTVEQVLPAFQSSASSTPVRSAGLAQSRPTRNAKPSQRAAPRAKGISGTSISNDTHRGSDGSFSNGSKETAGYDPFTELHLSKRHLAHSDIAREMADKEVYTIPHLFKEVKAPHYDPPDCERDYVVFAILASKSQPFDKKQSSRTNDENKTQEDADKPRNKFMILHLTDLKWEVDMFLFGTAFDQFWKLTPGTLIAILNPAIMPPQANKDSGRFSLKLGSSEDCVMEIGVARDLGYCASVKKDGQQCGTWIDKRKTEVCDFHLNMMIDRERKSRMEVNTMWRSHNDGKPRSNSKAGAAGDYDKGMGKDKNKSFHREYGRLYSVAGGGKSAANLLDAEDTLQQQLHAQEASRKRIAAAQKERDLMKRLGEMGKGVGAEYLRTKSEAGTTSSQTASTPFDNSDAAAAKSVLFNKPSIAELGLLTNKAEDQHLSPAKDRKRHFGLGALSSTNGGTGAIGWGGARKAGLLQPKEGRMGSPEKGQTLLQPPERTSGAGKPGIVRARSTDGSASGSLSPSKKRARFALEKGIREPGRESLGEVFKKATVVNGSDDDDELDIV